MLCIKARLAKRARNVRTFLGYEEEHKCLQKFHYDSVIAGIDFRTLKINVRSAHIWGFRILFQEQRQCLLSLIIL